MSEINNVGQTWMAKCDQLTPLSFKGLTETNESISTIKSKKHVVN